MFFLPKFFYYVLFFIFFSQNSTPYAHQRAEIDEVITNPIPTPKAKMKSHSIKNSSSFFESPKSNYVPPTTNYLTFSEALKVVHAGQANSSKTSKFSEKAPYIM